MWTQLLSTVVQCQGVPPSHPEREQPSHEALAWHSSAPESVCVCVFRFTALAGGLLPINEPCFVFLLEELARLLPLPPPLWRPSVPHGVKAGERARRDAGVQANQPCDPTQEVTTQLRNLFPVCEGVCPHINAGSFGKPLPWKPGDIPETQVRLRLSANQLLTQSSNSWLFLLAAAAATQQEVCSPSPAPPLPPTNVSCLSCRQNRRRGNVC